MDINKFLSKLFGNKSTRDMKLIQPWVEKIKAAYPAIQALDNDPDTARCAVVNGLNRAAVSADTNAACPLLRLCETVLCRLRQCNEISPYGLCGCGV